MKPPVFATWLLHHLGRPSESLEGDLLEQYRLRRSALWYWRQVLVAIVVGTVQAIRQDKVAAVRSLIAAAILFVLWNRVTNVTSKVTDSFAVSVANWLLEEELHGLRFWWFRLHLFNLAPTLLSCTGHFIIGWISVRMHPRRTVALGLAVCALVFLLSISEIYRITLRLAGDMVAGWDLRSRYVFEVLGWRLLFLWMFQPLSILAGGIAGADGSTRHVA